MKTALISLLFVIFSTASAVAEDSATFVNKGNEFAKEQKYDEAIQEYQKALALTPNSAKTHLITGLAYANAGDLEKALEHVKKSTELEPFYSSFYHLGLIYAVQNKPKKAVEAFDKALSLNPESYMAEYQKGLVYTYQKKDEKAKSAYERAIKLNPNFEEARIAFAGAAQKEGETEVALKQVEELRKMNKTNLADALEQWIASGGNNPASPAAAKG